jgi:hypothetical protein
MSQQDKNHDARLHTDAQGEESRQQAWGKDSRGDGQRQGGRLADEKRSEKTELDAQDDRQFHGEETPGRQMQERQHLAGEDLFEEQRADEWEPRDDLSRDPEDNHRQVREQQDRIGKQGGPRTPEERLGSGWADPNDPSQAMHEETVNEDEENLADKRT